MTNSLNLQQSTGSLVRALAVLVLCLAYNIASAQNDNPPVITSADKINSEEGQSKTSLFFTVTDADGTSSITYTITGGADRNLFRIDLSDLKGRPRLAFSFLPSFEDAKDANKDNKYEVEVTANDGKKDSDCGYGRRCRADAVLPHHLPKWW
ncbi:MAG: cadherin repeat domain-containing protein [Ekhidna sp.]|nr:cadherin repeat domain-containing protein [Ekhidna sp.]